MKLTRPGSSQLGVGALQFIRGVGLTRGMKPASEVLRVRVTLNDVRPAVWREVEVPGAYSFWDLHVALQDALGWQDCHLHAFRIAVTGVDQPVEIGIPDPDMPAQMAGCLAGWLLPVRSLLREGDRAAYLYDFGDGWEHEVVLEGIRPSQSSRRYPRCSGGEGACPPEDCGGPGGYDQLLKIIADPGHEEYDRMTTWLGRRFDSEAFDPKRVQFDNPKQRWNRAFGERQSNKEIHMTRSAPRPVRRRGPRR